MMVFHFIVDGLFVVYQNEIKTHKETRNKSFKSFNKVIRHLFFDQYLIKLLLNSLILTLRLPWT